jgi:predicted O-methyltransferase YrrM
MTFGSVMQFTRKISSPTAFEDEECMAYYHLLCSLASGSSILEIGLQFGRSSSIALQVAAHNDLEYYGVDPFTDPPEAKDAWVAMAGSVSDWRSVSYTKSADVNPNWWPQSIGLALIDGDHSATGVRTDCNLVMPRITPRGYICFHDYGRDSLPDVFATVNEMMIGTPFWHVATVGTLGIWQRNA